MRPLLALIVAGGLFLLTCCADTGSAISTQPSTVSSILSTFTPTATITPTSTLTPIPALSPAPADTPIPPTQSPSSGNPPRIFSFTAEKTQDNGVLFTWEASGIMADICPLLDLEILSYNCRRIYAQSYEGKIVGSEIWPADEIGMPYTGFRLMVEGSNYALETAEVPISGLSCSHDWFFGNRTDWCPDIPVTSLAIVQHFEHGQMIWIKKLDKFYIFYDSGLQAWPTNLDIVFGPLAPNASVDNPLKETPPPGYIEPVGNFGLIWRGEVEGTQDVHERLGWAKEPEIEFETIYQCVVGSDDCDYYPAYVRDAEGKILNLYYLTHFGHYWQEEFNWKPHSNAQHGYSIKYPDFLMYSTETHQGTDGVVTIDKWLPADQSYVISIVSYADGVNPALEFNAIITTDKITRVAGLEVREVVGTEIVSHKGTLVHIGPVSHSGKNQMLIYSSGSQVADSGSLDIFYKMLPTFKVKN
jgi:hypothetical protein